ncbi:Outer membrane lipoprotein carrier protein LolA [Minicystis rosea]|nr:Outer membrane lipoprotein carrier protein LolA [Minicystis rosea]
MRTVPVHPLRLGAIACLALAACERSEPAAGTTGSAVSLAPQPSAVSPAATTTPTASAEPTSSAASTALPSADPPTVHTAAASASVAASKDAGSPQDAGAKPSKVTTSAKPDAGASDAGAVAASDAGATAVSPALAIAQQVDAIFATKKTFVAKFEQQYTLKATGAIKNSSGTVSIERPSKISFRYAPPNDNRIVSDGTTIKVYMADEKQMMEMPAQQTAYPGALSFMLGSGIAKSFDFAINPRAKWSGVVLDGKPLTPNPSYELAMFYIDQTLLGAKDPNAMKRVLVVDAQGNKNRFDFESITQPATIDPAEFTFTPPPGTDIKRQGP